MSNVGIKEWEVLRRESIRYCQQGEILAKAESWKGAIENFHLGLEIALKAAIVKLGGTHPHTHELDVLAEFPIRGKKIIGNAIRGHRSMNQSFAAIKTVWNMQLRYNSDSWPADEADDFIEEFERVQKWILTKFVE